jgi:hypothetical protein
MLLRMTDAKHRKHKQVMEIRVDQERQEGFHTLSLAETGTLYFYLLLKYQQIFDKRVEEKREKVNEKNKQISMGPM